MNVRARIDALIRLGEWLRQEDEYLTAVMHRSQHHNAWFTLENQQQAVESIAVKLLDPTALQRWIEHYDHPEPAAPLTVGLVMAGNIPLVGFHDLLCVFAAGHRAQIKLSEKDAYLLPYLLKLLADIAPESAGYFEIVPQLKGFDAVIATRSNNTARYFESYFGKYPHIIRRNRNGIAVLSGHETHDELHALGKDVFRFFGLGCRNVAKLYVPAGYDFQPLLEALHDFRELILHPKYKNNFDYNFALYILNRVPHLANGCILLKEDPSFQSRIASLHYEFYTDLSALEDILAVHREEIQCIVAQPNLLPHSTTIPFGQTQSPGLFDYPDGVDVMEFLEGL